MAAGGHRAINALLGSIQRIYRVKLSTRCCVARRLARHIGDLVNRRQEKGIFSVW